MEWSRYNGDICLYCGHCDLNYEQAGYGRCKKHNRPTETDSYCGSFKDCKSKENEERTTLWQKTGKK